MLESGVAELHVKLHTYYKLHFQEVANSHHMKTTSVIVIFFSKRKCVAIQNQ